MSVALLVVKLKKHCKNSIWLFQWVLLNVHKCWLSRPSLSLLSMLICVIANSVTSGCRHIRLTWDSVQLILITDVSLTPENWKENSFLRVEDFMVGDSWCWNHRVIIWLNFVFWSRYIWYVFLLLLFCWGFTVVQHFAHLLFCLTNKSQVDYIWGHCKRILAPFLSPPFI